MSFKMMLTIWFIVLLLAVGALLSYLLYIEKYEAAGIASFIGLLAIGVTLTASSEID